MWPLTPVNRMLAGLADAIELLGQAEVGDLGDGGLTFLALGVPVSGQARIEDRAVQLDIDLPWMLSMLTGGIKDAIEQQGRKLLGSR